MQKNFAFRMNKFLINLRNRFSLSYIQDSERKTKKKSREAKWLSLELNLIQRIRRRTGWLWNRKSVKN